jgi:hypothetical protein
MNRLLGDKPKYLGWLNLNQGYGFVFSGKVEPVLVTWGSKDKASTATFSADVRVTDISGKASVPAAGRRLALTQTPAFITHLPADLLKQARSNLNKPYPWAGDYTHAKQVTCRLGAINQENGLRQINSTTTLVVNGLTDTCRRTDFTRTDMEGHYVYFRVDSQFVPYGTKNLAITIVAKRVAPDKDAGMKLVYESVAGYRGADGWWWIPADDQWHEYTWTVSDASFVGQWDWNFRFDAVGSPNEFLIKEVRVTKGKE